ncbi:sugar ABC transporter substrate-binding protein [Bifidobacterium rousetti]|uniref:sugar ABC transporter substrate-binding protein n=1 Tax=Bifidobacterium rousetti TaxID=2045439 RepID=UPI00123BC39E|nr:sugar ABC transporter substrate-binding protein [Bifidobacterium rousetti]KAA8816729.1 sugar ABC transporter substrate-binding protein [Bifidobacterium rousetti]
MTPPRAGGRASAALACAAACLALTACTPAGKAVGDTQTTQPEVAHVGIQRNEARIALIGSPTAAADKPVLDAMGDTDIQTIYVSSKKSKDPDAARRQGVEDMVDRVVNLIVVSDLDVSADASGWDAALGSAREAGIPVALLNPVHAPDDATLYAATLVLNDRAADATKIDDAMMTILNDEPHEREIVVTTIR